MKCNVCGEKMIITTDNDNLDGAIPYKHHWFCESCGNTREWIKGEN